MFPKRFVFSFLLIPFFLGGFAICGYSAEESRYFQNVTVEAGDTLWSISQRYLKDPLRWPEIVKYNSLPGSDPTIALPGQVIKIPVLLIKEELRAAKMMELVRSVDFRRRQFAEWQRAQRGMELYQEDGVRTGELSKASIRFAVGEDLTLEAKSFAVIRPDRLTEDMPRGVSLVEGSIRALNVRVLTQTAKITPKTKETDYRAQIREDLATIVEVFKGITDVEAKGKTVAVREGFGTEVPVGKEPSPPIALPPMPQIPVGLNGEPLSVSSQATPSRLAQGRPIPAVTIEKGMLVPAIQEGLPTDISVEDARPGIFYYRVQVADGPDAMRIVWEGSLPIFQSLSLRETGLKDGVYYLRVSLRDRLGLEGSFGPWNKIEIDTKPPALAITQPDSLRVNVQKSPMIVSGRTEPQLLVDVGDRAVVAGPDGSFTIQLPLRPGLNRVRVAAADKTGNISESYLKVFYQTAGYELAKASDEESAAETGDDEDKKIAPGAERLARFGLGAAVAVVIMGVVVVLIF